MTMNIEITNFSWKITIFARKIDQNGVFRGQALAGHRSRSPVCPAEPWLETQNSYFYSKTAEK